MKRSSLLGMMLIMLSMAIPAMGAMSTSQIRQNSRFLTDRMAYELNLSDYQYDDAYEINYDFLHNVRYLLDDVARGIPQAVDRYYDFLDIRNDDLRWILSNNQYRRFMNEDYFYRPVYAQNSRWQLRIYFVYTNVNFFYFGKPKHYSSYRGGHYRSHYNNISFYQQRYKQRYKHELYKGNYYIRKDKRRYEEHKKNDFGSASRPSNSRPGSNNNVSTSRPGGNNNNSSTSRPNGNNNNSSTSRPSGNNNNSSTSRPNGNNNNSSTSRPNGNNNSSTSRPNGNNNNSSTSRPSGNNNSNAGSNSRPSQTPSSTTKEKRETRSSNTKSSSTRESSRSSKTEKESQSSNSRR